MRVATYTWNLAKSHIFLVTTGTRMCITTPTAIPILIPTFRYTKPLHERSKLAMAISLTYPR